MKTMIMLYEVPGQVLHCKELSALQVQAIERVLQYKSNEEVDVLATIQIVLSYFCITEEQFLGKSRKPKIIEARVVVANYLRRKTDLTMEEIGKYLGGKHHASIVHYLLHIKSTAWKDDYTAIFREEPMPIIDT